MNIEEFVEELSKNTDYKNVYHIDDKIEINSPHHQTELVISKSDFGGWMLDSADGAFTFLFSEGDSSDETFDFYCHTLMTSKCFDYWADRISLIDYMVDPEIVQLDNVPIEHFDFEVLTQIVEFAE